MFSIRSLFSRFKYVDLPLQIGIFLLILVGLALLYSTTLSDPSASIFWKQVIFFVLGLAAFIFFSLVDYHQLAKANRLAYVVAVLLLFYVLSVSTAIRGGRRWISLGGLNLQTAEFVKIIIILGLGRLLYLRRGSINSWTNIFISFLYVIIPAGLILLEPDLGSTIVILCIWAGVLLMSPINKKFILILVLAFCAIGGLTWKFGLKSFQRDRVLVFLNPNLDPQGKGYNVRQAAIAIGSGEAWGRGLGKGLQSQSKFLPERQTDFIFAASSEEIGFVGDDRAFRTVFFHFGPLIVDYETFQRRFRYVHNGRCIFLVFFPSRH